MDIIARMEISANEIPNLLFPPRERQAYRSASYANSYVAILTCKERSIKTKNEATRSEKSRSFFSKFLLAS